MFPQSGGRIEEQSDRVRVRGADEVVILIAMATSYRRFDDVSGDPAAATREQIAQARRRSFAEIAARTAEEHRRLFRRVTFDLGRTAAASRPTDERIRDQRNRGRPGARRALFPVWPLSPDRIVAAGQPARQPAGHVERQHRARPGAPNTRSTSIREMNYWPAEPTGLAECVAPLVEMVRDLAETGARTAREMYGARGWVVHHNTDLWRATAPVDGARWGLWPTGGAWLCLHLWDHYDYGRDEAYLRSVYPLLRGAAQFFLDTLQRDPSTGLLVTNPSLSPENVHPHGASLCAGPAMDMQILRDLFDRTARAATILGVDAELVADLVAARARVSRPIRSDGTASSRSGSSTGTMRRPSPTTAMSPISTACSRATRSISTRLPRSPGRRGARSNCAATSRPAGRPRGERTYGRSCATASMRTRSSVSCSVPSAPTPTCSMRTRRSRSTAISAGPAPSSRC